jgi:hypothetical protein
VKNVFQTISLIFVFFGILFFVPGKVGSSDTKNNNQLDSAISNLATGVLQAAQTFNLNNNDSNNDENLDFAPVAKKPKVMNLADNQLISTSAAETFNYNPVVLENAQSSSAIEQPNIVNVISENEENEELVVETPVQLPETPSQPDIPVVPNVPSVPYDSSKIDPVLAKLISRESGGNLHAVSASGQHFGLGQLLDNYYVIFSGKHYSEVRDNADIQIQVMLGYINSRYGSVQAAFDWSNKYGWY